MKVDYSGLPEHLRGGMQRYIEHGVTPGSFLQTVLSNDLMRACMLADPINRNLLFDIASWLYQHAPMSCYGSRTGVDAWIRQHREAKEAQAS